MTNYLCLILSLLLPLFGRSQDNLALFAYKPFTIYQTGGQLIMAGDLHTVVYHQYFGRNVAQEGYTDPHARPENLIYQLFKDIRAMDGNGIRSLYDSTFDRARFDLPQMASLASRYTDVQFRSKFRSGDLLVIRYDFINQGKPPYSYFAVIKTGGGRYYLTMAFNLSDPFHILGSLSPNNLFERSGQPVKTTGMTPFYFVHKNDTILFTNDLPGDEYTALYILFVPYSRTGFTPETAFLGEMERAAQSPDSTALRKLVAPDQERLLKDPYFSSYVDEQLRKIFRNFPSITPLAGIRIRDGRVLWFTYSDSTGNSGLASVILRSSGGRFWLAFRVPDDDVGNILTNPYMSEAIADYMRRRSGQ
jgi:hypothetical protein